MPNAVIAHDPSGHFDLKALTTRAAGLPSMTGLDLVPLVSGSQRFEWDETPWELGRGFGHRMDAKHHVVAIDYGVKRNILRLLARRRLRSHGGACDRQRRGRAGAASRTACFYPTAPATRRQPANTPCR